MVSGRRTRDERPPLRYASKTPADVRQWIETIRAKPRYPKEPRAALERFATHDSMNEFWSKIATGWRALPCKNQQLDTIRITPSKLGEMALGHALEVYRRALSVHDPAVDVQHLVEIEIREIRPAAIDLRKRLSDTGNLIPSLWNELWTGPPDWSFGDLLAALDATIIVGEKLTAKVSEAETALKLPQPPKKRDAEVFFSQTMGDFFLRLCKKPRHELIAILTTVAFNLPNTVTADTVRKRRRRPEH
jgi:hypothetical protein